MARPANANAEATRARILDAALRLFADVGRGQTSVRDIARAADVSLGMVNHYFGSKDELYEACVENMLEEISSLGDRLAIELAGAPMTAANTLERASLKSKEAEVMLQAQQKKRFRIKKH